MSGTVDQLLSLLSIIPSGKSRMPRQVIPYLVEGHRLDPERDTHFVSKKETDGQKTISGTYADFIEHQRQNEFYDLAGEIA